MVNIGSLPFDVQHLIFTFLDQQKKIDQQAETIAFLMNKIEALKTTLELQRQDINNLEYILANDGEAQVARRLIFDNVDESDWSDSTIIELSDIEDIDI